MCLRQQPPVWQSVLNLIEFSKIQSQYIFVPSLDVTTYAIDKHDSVAV